MQDLKDCKVGDEVYFLESNSWVGKKFIKCRIEKITPAGRIKIGTKLFNLDGHERTSGHYGGYIMPINDENTKIVEEESRRISVNNRMAYLNQYNFKMMPPDLVMQIYQIVKQHEDNKKADAPKNDM